MANLTEDSSTWVSAIYRIDEGDSVMAWDGTNIGIANTQGKQLADRTAFLKRVQDMGSIFHGSRVDQVLTNPTALNIVAADFIGKLIRVDTSAGTGTYALPALSTIPDDACVYMSVEPGAGFNWVYNTIFRNVQLTANGAETIVDFSKNVDEQVCNLQPNTIIKLFKLSATKWGVVRESSGEQCPVGTVITFAAANPPIGWLKADGSSVLRATYPQLFAVIGTVFGSGSPTTFNVPNITAPTNCVSAIKY